MERLSSHDTNLTLSVLLASFINFIVQKYVKICNSVHDIGITGVDAWVKKLRSGDDSVEDLCPSPSLKRIHTRE